jgi:hypothetical protein
MTGDEGEDFEEVGLPKGLAVMMVVGPPISLDPVVESVKAVADAARNAASFRAWKFV